MSDPRKSFAETQIKFQEHAWGVMLITSDRALTPVKVHIDDILDLLDNQLGSCVATLENALQEECVEWRKPLKEKLMQNTNKQRWEQMESSVKFLPVVRARPLPCTAYARAVFAQTGDLPDIREPIRRFPEITMGSFISYPSIGRGRV